MKIEDIQARLEAPWLTPALRGALREAGFETLLDAARALKKGALPLTLAGHASVLREAGDAVRATLRDKLAGQDPSGFAHVQLDTPSESTASEAEGWAVAATEYVEPNSMESKLSPAAYLYDIYTTLRAGVTAPPKWSLDERRPDLSELRLNKDNFDKPISKLDLVMEVLQRAALPAPAPAPPPRAAAADTADALDALYREMATDSHPFELPFDRAHCMVREALAAMSSDLNAVARETSHTHYALADTAYTLAPNALDALNLYAHHREILVGDYQLPAPPGPGTSTAPDNDAYITGVNLHSDKGQIVGLTPTLVEARMGEIAALGYFIHEAGSETLLRTLLTTNLDTVTLEPPLAEGAVGRVRCQVYPKVLDAEFKIIAAEIQANGSAAVGYSGGYYTVGGTDDLDGCTFHLEAIANASPRPYYRLLDQTGACLNKLGSGRTEIGVDDALLQVESPDQVTCQFVVPDASSGEIETYWLLRPAPAVCEFEKMSPPSPQTRFHAVPTDWGRVLLTTNPKYFTEVKHVQPYEALSLVNAFLAYASINSAELAELVRNYPVYRESDNAVVIAADQVYARYINRGQLPPIRVVDRMVDGMLTAFLARGDNLQLDDLDLIAMDRFVRLHKRTGIPFHQLDWLLGAVNALHGIATPTLSDDTLAGLARYAIWRDRFGLTVDEYVGLIGHLNEHVREDYREESFLRQLFGEQVTWIAAYTAPNGTQLLQDLSTAELDGLWVGLRLTELEWQLLRNQKDPHGGALLFPPERRLDAACLSALYRFSRLLPLLGWGVGVGVALIHTVMPQALAVLAQAPSASLALTLDRLAWLSEGMRSVGLGAADVLAMLQVPADDTLRANQELVNMLDGLFGNLHPHLLQRKDFDAWAVLPMDLGEFVAVDWLQELQKVPGTSPTLVAPVVDAHGLVTDYTREQIDQIVAGILTRMKVAGGAAAVRAEVVALLVEAQARRHGVLAAAMGQGLEAPGEAVESVLKWMALEDAKITSYYCLTTLLADHLRVVDGAMAGRTDVERLNGQTLALALLHRLGRYSTVIDTLELTPEDVRIVVEDPYWVTPETTGRLDFELLYHFARFKRLKHPEAEGKDWSVYLLHAPEAPMYPGLDLKGLLAALLDCDVNELEVVIKNELADKLPVNFRELDLVVRHLEQAHALAMGQAELARIRQMALARPGTPRSMSWDMAMASAGAAMVGASNYPRSEKLGHGNREVVTAPLQPAPPPPWSRFLKPTRAHAQSEFFGASVAISADGATMAVGAYGDVGDAESPGERPGAGAGSVYVYVRHGAGWVVQAYLQAAHPDANDAFGTAVALSADGNLLLVGAPYEASSATGVDGPADNNDATGTGAAYVFVRNAGSWTQRNYLKASDASSLVGGSFGGTVAVNADGTTLAVGAHYESNLAGTTGTGAVYVFVASGASWVQQYKLMGSATEFFDRLSRRSLALSGDGNTLVAGVHRDVSYHPGASEACHVYIFVRVGNQWSEQRRLEFTNVTPADQSADRYVPVALDASGQRLAVGANRAHTEEPALRAMAVVRLYARINGIWREDAVLDAPAVDAGAYGTSVALSGDGEVLALGTSRQTVEGKVKAGTVSLFKHNADGWTMKRELKAEFRDDGDYFGSALALDQDGRTLVAGMHLEDSAAPGEGVPSAPNGDNSAFNVGAVYTFHDH